MNDPSSFCDTLCYMTPARGGWSIVRTALLVPESYQLFVGASACMRHIILSSLELKIADRLSCLFLKETDVISGSYEQLAVSAVDELMEKLNPTPKVLMIFMTCMDELLGTDHNGFLMPIRQKYPHMRTIICYMNPLMVDSIAPPAIMIQNSMYDLLDSPGKRDNAVNFIGNNIAIDPQNELIQHLKTHGIASRHISHYKKFDEFQQMGCSQLNIVATPTAVQAAKQLKQRLDIDYVSIYPSYSFDEIDADIDMVCSKLKIPKLETKSYREAASKRLEDLARQLKGRPVAIDYEATYRPFGMARLLLEHGINVDTIYTDECAAYEMDDGHWIEGKNITIIRPDIYNREHRARKDCVCIGFESAYLEGSSYCLTLAADAELLGYNGILTLADKLEMAASKPGSLKKLIDESALVV